MSILRFILFTQCILSIFISGGLFFKFNEIKGRSISLFVFLFGFEMGVYLFSTSEILFLYPQFSSLFYFSIGFIYGPLLLIHILSIQGTTFNWKIVALHFIPVIVVIISMLDIYAMSGLDRIQYIRENFMNRIMPYNYARALHILVYGIVCGVLVRRYYYKDGLEKVYSFAICIIYFFAAVLISFFTLFADGWRQFIYYYLVANAIVLTIGYLLYEKPNFLKGISTKYFRSTLTKETMKKIKSDIQKEVVESSLYLDKNLNLNKMADQIGESSHRISQTMSILVGQNFNDYINFHRVEHAKRMLIDSNFNHFKIEAIALDSGFNNKVTFHKAFVKFTGVTPSVFKSESNK